MLRILFISIAVGFVTRYLLKKRNIQINLSPTGRNAIMMTIQRIFQFFLRRIGF
ncbi:MAG: hypothetical protein HQM00_09670 [Magnetococcales bacterium]|nr:hypothetical protein [Magnetococcales bacterium]